MCCRGEVADLLGGLLEGVLEVGLPGEESLGSLEVKLLAGIVKGCVGPCYVAGEVSILHGSRCKPTLRDGPLCLCLLVGCEWCICDCFPGLFDEVVVAAYEMVRRGAGAEYVLGGACDHVAQQCGGGLGWLCAAAWSA